MNAKQKWTMVVAAVAFVISFLFAPWEVTLRRGSTIQRSYTEAAPLWSAPSVDYGTARLRVEVLVLEWTALAIIGGCVVLLLSRPSQPLRRESAGHSIDAPSLDAVDSAESAEQMNRTPDASPSTEKPEALSTTGEMDKRKTGPATLIQWVFLVGAAIGCSAYLAHLRYLGGDSIGKTASMALAEATGGALVFLGLPVLFSFLFKKPSRFAVRLVGLCIMVFLSWLEVEERAKPAADFVSEVNERRADWKKDVAGQLDSKGVYEVDLAKAERAMDAVKQKTQKLDGRAKEMGEALLPVNEQMLVLAKRYEAARKEYVESGGTDASTIRTLEQLEARDKVIRDFGVANDALLDFLQSIDIHLNTALANMEISSYQRTEAIQNYKKGASLEVLLAIRELDQQAASDSLALVSLLRKEWGKWRVQGNAVLFDRGAAATEFNSALGRIAAAGEQQVELQRHFTK